MGVGVPIWLCGSAALGRRPDVGIVNAVLLLAALACTAEGLALALNWRGSATYFQALRDSDNPSRYIRYVTWHPDWWPYSFVTAVRVAGFSGILAGLFYFTAFVSSSS